MLYFYNVEGVRRVEILMVIIEIHTKKISLAAYALYNGGEFVKYEKGEFFVKSLWSIAELINRYRLSGERRFDNHIIRLRDLKRNS